MNKISFVLPLKINAYESGSDLERVKKILFPSLVKYFDLTQISQFLIIVPTNEQQTVREQLKEFKEKFNLSVIPEKEVLALIPGWSKHVILHRALHPFKIIDKRFNGGNFFEHLRLKRGWDFLGGWTKQQMLKLFAARLVNSDYYVTLDADICLTRPADLKTLFPDGKALCTLVPVGSHSDWWVGSAEVLGIRLRLRNEDLAMGVTPVILSTPVVAALIDHLILKSRENQYLTIFEYLSSAPTWTEYTLYWLFLLEFYKQEEYYTDQNHIQLRHKDYSVWARREAPDLNALRKCIDLAFRDQQSLFLVIQSSCIPLVEYREAIKDYLS